MDIFNTKILNQRQRWNRALLYALGASVLCILVCVFAQRLIQIRSALFYIASAYFIGWIILESGHGVQKKFSILAAACTILIILFSDIFTLYGMSAFSMPLQALLSVLRLYMTISINSLLSLLLKIAAVAIAYGRARVL